MNVNVPGVIGARFARPASVSSVAWTERTRRGDTLNSPTNIWEFYELLRVIEGRLDETGESEWANRLRDAVLGGATSGEILERVGVELRHLDGTEVPARSGVATELLIADRFITEALGAP